VVLDLSEADTCEIEPVATDELPLVPLELYVAWSLVAVWALSLLLAALRHL
jgi:hypothetical protein